MEIKDGSTVILQKGNFLKACRVFMNRTMTFGKRGKNQFTIAFKGAEGCCYGSYFKMVTSKKSVFDLEKIDKFARTTYLVSESGEDNRELLDDGRSQKLTKDDIEELVSSGVSGQEVIQTLTENSSTFKAKTKFSQEKYVAKKQLKYNQIVILHKPSVRLLAEMYYQDPLKTLNLRIDSLAQMLCHVNVMVGGHYAIFEAGSKGLVTAATLQRLGGQGSLVQVYHGNSPQREAIDFMNFTQEDLEVLSFIGTENLPVRGDKVKEENKDLNAAVEKHDAEKEIISSEEPEQKEENCATVLSQKDSNEPPKFRKFVRKKVEDISLSTKVLLNGVEGLIVACRQHPSSITLALLRFLKPGCPLVIFSPYKEPLLDLFSDLKCNGGVNLKLTETWLRHYQVMDNRTHPEISMSGGGGYLLYGAKVEY
ncbi:tRNA methyltransferase 6 non-catalytic subunit [Oratosquilla oratoria]|uniref:tRNA methyltransferase 6 non-catalytic subunit n=1 Tax=Oratosquilla oratoria TaxID=337810 RepID=UPI003F760EF5